MKPPTNTFIEFIRQRIEASHGFISFAEFMDHALYHPKWGYYTSADFDIGQYGDFTTAPEMSSLFAHCIGNQCREIFNSIGQNQILEVGAGTGKFAHDLLHHLETLNSLPSHYYIYEKSAPLRKKQQVFLQTACPHFYSRVIWLDELPKKMAGVIIANEVLDALPVHCFRIEHTIKERCVTWKNDALTWAVTEPTTDELIREVSPIYQTYHLPLGYESEINLGLQIFLQSLIQTLDEGVLLLIDYGYGQREYYRQDRAFGTLNCFTQHRYHTNPLILPGQQDITAHVDFTRTAEIALANDCQLLGYTTQSAFLLACGLMDLAGNIEKNLSHRDAITLHQAIKLLTFPTEMGDRVKVMALGKKLSLALLGFKTQDRRRDL